MVTSHERRRETEAPSPTGMAVWAVDVQRGGYSRGLADAELSNKLLIVRDKFRRYAHATSVDRMKQFYISNSTSEGAGELNEEQ
jgi:hypothetical protein